jgi:hypothetical protein
MVRKSILLGLLDEGINTLEMIFREWKKSKKKKGKVRRIIHSESYVHRYRRTEPN